MKNKGSRGVRQARMGVMVQPPSPAEPIGYIPPAEAEAKYYRQLASQGADVGRLKLNSLLKTWGHSIAEMNREVIALFTLVSKQDVIIKILFNNKGLSFWFRIQCRDST